MEPRHLPLPPAEALLVTAEARLRRQTGYARALSGRPGRKRVLEAGLAEARAVLAAALRPGALWREVPEGTLGAAEAEGGRPLVWLCTLGHDAAGVAERLGEDRMGVHLAGDLAVQALHAASRAAHAGLVAGHPGQRVLRVALRAPGAARWDAAAVARLLPLFGPAPLGVSRIGDGGFRPAHTLLGVCALRPTG